MWRLQSHLPRQMWFQGLSRLTYLLELVCCCSSDKCLLLCNIRPTESSLLWAAKAATDLHCPTQGHINPAALCHNLVYTDLDHLSLTQDIILVHCIEHTMLLGPSEQVVATTVDLLQWQHVRGWETNLTTSQGLLLNKMIDLAKQALKAQVSYLKKGSVVSSPITRHSRERKEKQNKQNT